MIADTESDQVLLGSVFDDTKTVQMARNAASPRVYQLESDRSKQNQHQLATQKEHELTVVQEDDVAKTHRVVNEDWRR